MKIRIPEKLIKLAYNFVDFETSGDSSKPSIRMYEYSWALSKLVKLPAGTLLDVGCTARMNMIPAAMCRLGWIVTGIDLRKYYYEHPNFFMYINDIVYPYHIHESTFDVITAISSVEHFGLDIYGNKAIYDDYDVITLKNIHNRLKNKGLLFLTVPYTYGKPYIMNKAARVYNWESLCKLLERFKIIDTEEVTINNETTIMVEAIKA